MKPALLLVDMQNPFLNRAGIMPSRSKLVSSVEKLLRACRELDVSVLHARTAISENGVDAVSNRQAGDTGAGADRAEIAAPPVCLTPDGSEPVFTKRFYSAFEDPGLNAYLRERGVDTLLIAGIYLHSCIRATILDAFSKGYTIWAVSDALGSIDPVHAQISRQWMENRICSFYGSTEILSRLNYRMPQPKDDGSELTPVAFVREGWVRATEKPHVVCRNPSNSAEVSSRVPMADPEVIEEAIRSCKSVLPAWQSTPQRKREELLSTLAEVIEKDRDRLVELTSREIGKPMIDAGEEISRAVDHIRATVKLFSQQGASTLEGSYRVVVRRRPVGIIGLITPMNNPVAIPVAKIAAALVFGNAVIWKPSLPAPRTAIALMNSIQKSGFPPGLVSMVFGDAETASRIISHTDVGAISLTGETATGRLVNALCAQKGKPLQAELGGNNAAIVMHDSEVKSAARILVSSAFSFAGQRCTAIRRFILMRSIRDEFLAEMKSAVERLRTGNPERPETQVGPVISKEHLERVKRAVDEAIADGCTILARGRVPAGPVDGCWYPPTVLESASPDIPIVQDETFGPVAVVQLAEDYEEAIDLCNRVSQGLVACIFTEDRSVQQSFIDTAQAGILRINPRSFPIHPQAPFGGFKASAIGPPEHGVWDQEFYTRPQAVYEL